MSIDITRVGLHRLLDANGTVISQHTDLKEAYENASELPAGTYTLVTADERIVVSGGTPVPVRVDCAGTWSAWTRVAGSESSCVSGSRTFQERRVFTVTQQPANGGTACPVSPETRTQTEACGVVEPPPTNDLTGRLLNFAQTWKRNWNHGGHTVVLNAGSPPFNENYGYWDYTPTTYEPWLFDRATCGFRLHALTQDPQWLQQAQSDLAWYAQRIDGQGIFTPKGNDDTKYSYITPFVLGVNAGVFDRSQAVAIATRIFNAWVNDWPEVANLSSAALWTEREMAFSLEAAVAFHELTQDPRAIPRAKALLNQWDAVVAQTGNQGAPRVSYTKHEGGGPGGTSPTDPTNSPWMTALYFQAAKRLVEIAPETATQVYRQASNYFDYLNVHGFYPGSDAHPEYTGLVFPKYLTETTIGDAGPDEGNMCHALDVAGMLKFCALAKSQRGEPTTTVNQRLNEMLVTTNRAFDLYTRTATWLPKYRVNPPRMANWWVRGLYELRALGVE
jgi:hypothetical protein